jgi:hypothetical protein
MLLEPRSLARGYLNAGEVRRTVSEHREGRRDHGELLWGLLNLELWQRILIERTMRPQGLPRLPRPSPPPAEVACP